MAYHKIVVVKSHRKRSSETTENISGPKRIIVTDLTASATTFDLNPQYIVRAAVSQ